MLDLFSRSGSVWLSLFRCLFPPSLSVPLPSSSLFYSMLLCYAMTEITWNVLSTLARPIFNFFIKVTSNK